MITVFHFEKTIVFSGIFLIKVNNGVMASLRQNKVSRLIQRELSEIFQLESRRLFNGKMITVTVVRLSGDLGLAKVYLSIFPVKEDEDALKAVNDQKSRIRFELGNRIRNQLRRIPELMFYLDDSIDYADNIDKLLKK